MRTNSTWILSFPRHPRPVSGYGVNSRGDPGFFRYLIPTWIPACAGMTSLFKFLSVIGLSLLLSGCAQDLTKIPFDRMINNVSSSFPALWRLSTGFAYFMGIVFMMRGVYKFKQYGDMATMMSSQRSIKEPLILLIVGTALMFFPSTKATLLVSAFGYTQQAPIPPYSQTIGGLQLIPNMLKLIQLLGVVAFIRGWVQLSHASHPGSQNSMGKAVTHIIGGLLAINIQGTIDVLQASFMGK